MRWTKVLLFFQAIVTIIIGLTFFSQVSTIGVSEISDLIAKFSSTENISEGSLQEVDSIRYRFSAAAYLLLIIGLIEIVIISRLIS